MKIVKLIYSDVYYYDIKEIISWLENHGYFGKVKTDVNCNMQNTLCDNDNHTFSIKLYFKTDKEYDDFKKAIKQTKNNKITIEEVNEDNYVTVSVPEGNTRDNVKTYLSLIRQSLKRYLEYMSSITWIYDYTNAKLHELFYTLENDFDTDHFYAFCDVYWDEYRTLVDALKLKIEYLGRTSSFRITDDYFYKYMDCINTPNNFNSDKYVNEFEFYQCLFEYFISDKTTIDSDKDMMYRYDYKFDELEKYFINNDDLIDIAENYDDDEYNLNYIDWTIETLKEYIEALNNDISFLSFKMQFDDILEARNYIKNFKENQIEYFKEFCQDDNDIIEEKHTKEKETPFTEYTFIYGTNLMITIKASSGTEGMSLYDARKAVFDVLTDKEKCKAVEFNLRQLKFNVESKEIDRYPTTVSEEYNKIRFI